MDGTFFSTDDCWGKLTLFFSLPSHPNLPPPLQANKQVAAKFAAAMTVVEVVYLGGVWLKEEDLMAPMVAMLIVSGVVFDQIRRRRTGSGGGTNASM